MLYIKAICDECPATKHLAIRPMQASCTYACAYGITQLVAWGWTIGKAGNTLCPACTERLKGE